MKKVEVILAFSNFRVGDTFEPAALYRDTLVRDGYIKVLDEETTQKEKTPEVATLQGGAEKADNPPVIKKRKRGRPAKIPQVVEQSE